MDELNARLNQLERQVRSLRRVANALGIALVVTLVTCAGFGSAKDKARRVDHRKFDIRFLCNVFLGVASVVATCSKLGARGVSFVGLVRSFRSQVLVPYPPVDCEPVVAV